MSQNKQQKKESDSLLVKRPLRQDRKEGDDFVEIENVERVTKKMNALTTEGTFRSLARLTRSHQPDGSDHFVLMVELDPKWISTLKIPLIEGSEEKKKKSFFGRLLKK